MDLKESIIDFISHAVPGKENILCKAGDIADHLVDELGMESVDQMQDIQDTDLTRALSLFNARTLIKALKENHNRAEGRAREPEQSTRGERIPLAQITNQQRDWEFKIDWKDLYKIDKSLEKKLRRGKKLQKRMKNEIVKRLVVQVRNKVPGAHRSIFRQLAMEMKQKYPISFSGELAGGKVSKYSICKKMQDKYDNDRRPARRTGTETEAPAIKPAYGCKRWRVLSIPEGESEGSLGTLQTDLKDHFETVRPRHWNWDNVMEAMSKTYCNQRRDINKQAEQIEKARKQKRKRNQQDENNDIELTTTEELRNNWPFLFQPRGMLAHFAQLTEVNITEKITQFLEADMKDIVQFLLDTNKDKTSKIKKRLRRSRLPGQNPRQAALILLLQQRFRERNNGIFFIIDKTAGEDDIPQLIDIPKTPRLIIAGENIFNYEKVFISMDGQVLSTASNLIEGFGLLFSSYFVFNLVYEATAQLTLEFFQRCVADINPPRGNKRPDRETARAAGASFSPYSIHPALAKLDHKYEEFFAENAVDSEEENSEDVDDEGL